MNRWQVLSQLPSIPLWVAYGLWVFNVGGTQHSALFGSLFVFLGALWLSAPAWGYPVRNWGRMRSHLLIGGPWCKHREWTEWQPMGDGSGWDEAWCRSCGWVLRLPPGCPVYRVVPWRFRAGLPRGCGPDVDQMWRERS